MCGRMVITRSAAEIAEAFDVVAGEGVSWEARYNVAPSQPIPVVRVSGAGARTLSLLQWGLIPSWAKDRRIAYRMINARSETAAEKPSFRVALRRRRCIVPADAFYEWEKRVEPGGSEKKPTRIPHLFRHPGGEMLAIAGLWEEWTDKESGEVVESCTLLTTEANACVRPIHDRMPVILRDVDHALWLDPSQTSADAVLGLLVPSPPDALESFEVSRRVNDPRLDESSLIDPV